MNDFRDFDGWYIFRKVCYFEWYLNFLNGSLDQKNTQRVLPKQITKCNNLIKNVQNPPNTLVRINAANSSLSIHTTFNDALKCITWQQAILHNVRNNSVLNIALLNQISLNKQICSNIMWFLLVKENFLPARNSIQANKHPTSSSKLQVPIKINLFSLLCRIGEPFPKYTACIRW